MQRLPLVAVQVVGLQSGYHTALVMGGVNDKIHAKRLAQASEILIELRAQGRAPLLQAQLCSLQQQHTEECMCRSYQGYTRTNAHAAGRRAMAPGHPIGQRRSAAGGAPAVLNTVLHSISILMGSLRTLEHAGPHPAGRQEQDAVQ